MIKIVTSKNKSLGKFNLEYENNEYILHGDHYIRIPKLLYEKLMSMEIHRLPKHIYYEKEKDCIYHDGHYLKHFYLTY